MRGRRAIGLAAGGLLLLAGVSFALYFALGSDSGGAGTPVAEPSGAPAVSPPVSPGPRIRFARWGADEWQVAHVTPDASTYRESDALPFLLVIHEARPQDVYPVVLRYDCRTDGAAGFDFLTGYGGTAGTAPALAEGGPGRALPDAAIPIPDDVSIPFDDGGGGERLLQLWGATFAGVPLLDPPGQPCISQKLVFLSIRAQAETVFLLWGGHLASSGDWGRGQGAASPERSFGMGVMAVGWTAELPVAPGGISP